MSSSFIPVYSPLGQLTGYTELPSVTDPVRSDPVFRPVKETWVENNTGPLLPASNDPAEINFMKPDSHLSRAGNPALLGTDLRAGKEDWVHGNPSDILNQPADNSWVDKLKTPELPVTGNALVQEEINKRLGLQTKKKKKSLKLDPNLLQEEINKRLGLQTKKKKKSLKLDPDLLAKDVAAECELLARNAPVSQLPETEPQTLLYLKKDEKPFESVVPDSDPETMKVIRESLFSSKSEPLDTDFWSENQPDGSTLFGVKGGATHNHDYDNLGIGHIRLQSKSSKKKEPRYSYNNFNETVEALMPDWMTKSEPLEIPSLAVNKANESMIVMCVENGWNWEWKDGKVKIKF